MHEKRRENHIKKIIRSAKNKQTTNFRFRFFFLCYDLPFSLQISSNSKVNCILYLFLNFSILSTEKIFTLDYYHLHHVRNLDINLALVNEPLLKMFTCLFSRLPNSPPSCHTIFSFFHLLGSFPLYQTPPVSSSSR